jgi:hypothetical protein
VDATQGLCPHPIWDCIGHVGALESLYFRNLDLLAFFSSSGAAAA